MAGRFKVYVIQLSRRSRRVRNRRRPGMRCGVYVGYTGSTLEKRMARHIHPPSGWKPTVVTECGGGRFRPELCEGLRFLTKAEAIDAEASLAVYLHEQGYTVFATLRSRRYTANSNDR